MPSPLQHQNSQGLCLPSPSVGVSQVRCARLQACIDFQWTCHSVHQDEKRFGRAIVYTKMKRGLDVPHAHVSMDRHMNQ
eukprot:scaffold237313_cov26-Tisochrysis_lutea.AAC.1